MTKYLRLYNKAGTLLKSSGNIEGSTGTIKIENLFPETIYHSGDFLVSWVINGEELNKIPVPEFKTLSGVIDKTIIVYFSDINDENLVSLKGDSAYKIAIDNGFNGSQEEWLESLKGEPGEPGRQGDPGRDGVDITEGGSAYEIALAEGFQGTREEWLESLKGKPGEPGRQGEKGDPGEDGFGVDGASAYEIALENGFVGNIQDFLDSLVGKPGKDGQDGNDGLSAYEIAKEYGYTGTEQEWLDSLEGKDGLTAYQIAKEQGYNGTEQEWLESLKANLPNTQNWQKYRLSQDNGDRIRISDVDPITLSTGYYQIWRLKNAPEGKDDNGQYWNVDVTSAFDNVKQIQATISFSGKTYTKNIHKGVDQGWKLREIPDSTNWQKSKLTQDDGTIALTNLNSSFDELNKFTTSGFYYVANMPGLPGGITTAGFLNVYSRSGKNPIKHIFIPHNQSKVFVRHFYNSWSQWEDVSVDDTMFTETIQARAPYDNIDIKVSYNNKMVSVRFQGSIKGNTLPSDFTIAKLPAHIPYPKDTVRGGLLNIGADSTEDFQGNIIVTKYGDINVKFRKGLNGIETYTGGSVHYAIGNEKSANAKSTYTRVATFPENTVLSVQGTDYLDGFYAGAVIRSGNIADEIQVINTNEPQNSFVAKNNTGISMGHANGLRIVENNNGVLLAYVAHMYDTTLVPIKIDTINKTITPSNNLISLTDNNSKPIITHTIDSFKYENGSYVIRTFNGGVSYKFTTTDLNKPQTLKGEPIFNLPGSQIVSDRKRILNDTNNQLSTAQSNILIDNKYYIIQYGYNATAVLEYEIVGTSAVATGKYWYSYSSLCRRVEAESIMYINGSLHVNMVEEDFDKNYDNFIAKIAVT
ncbi:phosphodiester glycosidase family protein [Mammaliicoccus phage vB_MscM-PMS3]|nr:phosphodiester glycosidase family protein [Mammaliicoccus phage vB_MscM-PMS3]